MPLIILPQIVAKDFGLTMTRNEIIKILREMLEERIAAAAAKLRGRKEATRTQALKEAIAWLEHI